jgi:hypothetical protein
MRRALLLVALLGCHRTSDAPKSGAWLGDTTQGHPMQFTVQGKYITQMKIRLDIRCERSEKMMGIALRTVRKVPIEDGRFSIGAANPGIFIRWAGAFTPSGNANGRFDLAFPALTGTTVETLGTEKCAAIGVGWAARPGKRQDTEAAPDLVVTIDADGAVSTSTPSATTGW